MTGLQTAHRRGCLSLRRGWVLALALTVPLLIAPAENVHALPTEIKIAHWGHEKVFIYLPLYIAVANGYFAENGLAPSFVYSGNDDQVFAAVVANDAIVGVGDPVFAAISREHGGPGKAIGVLVDRVSNWGVAKDPRLRGLQVPNGLNGLRISSFPAPSTAYSILADIKKTRSLQNMQIVQLTPGTEIAALERNNVDIALTGEPSVSLAASKGYPVVLSLASYYGPFAFSGFTTTEGNISAHRTQLVKMLLSVQQALDFIRASPSEAIKLSQRLFPNLPPDVVSEAVHRMLVDDSIPQSVRVDSTSWTRTIQLRHEIGDLKSNNINVQAVDNSLADDALSEARLNSQLESPLDSNLASSPGNESPSRSSTTGSEGVGTTIREWLTLIADISGIVTVCLAAWYARRLRKVKAIAGKFLSENDRLFIRHIIGIVGPRLSVAFAELAQELIYRDGTLTVEKVRAFLERLQSAGALTIRTIGVSEVVEFEIHDGRPLIFMLA